MRFFLLLFILLRIHSLAQDNSRTRTKVVDQTKYDQLMAALPYTPNKIAASKNLMEEVNKSFKPEDEEYFFGRKMAAIYYEQAFDYTTALELIQQAIEAYEKHFPFYNRGYATVTKETALYIYTDLSRLQRSLGLYEKAAKYLEVKDQFWINQPILHFDYSFSVNMHKLCWVQVNSRRLLRLH